MARWLLVYLVVLQSLLAGIAGGAMAAPSDGDQAFLLCLNDTGSASGHSQDGQPVAHDCIACPLAGGTPLVPEPPDVSGTPEFHVFPAFRLTSHALTLPRRVASSAQPRAPPAFA